MSVWRIYTELKLKLNWLCLCFLFIYLFLQKTSSSSSATTSSNSSSGRLYNWAKLFAAAYIWTTLRKCLIQSHVVCLSRLVLMFRVFTLEIPGRQRVSVKRWNGMRYGNAGITEINTTINDPWDLKSSLLSSALSSNEREWRCSVISVTIRVSFPSVPCPRVVCYHTLYTHLLWIENIISSTAQPPAHKMNQTRCHAIHTYAGVEIKEIGWCQ